MISNNSPTNFQIYILLFLIFLIRLWLNISLWFRIIFNFQLLFFFPKSEHYKVANLYRIWFFHRSILKSDKQKHKNLKHFRQDLIFVLKFFIIPNLISLIYIRSCFWVQVDKSQTKILNKFIINLSFTISRVKLIFSI